MYIGNNSMDRVHGSNAGVVMALYGNKGGGPSHTNLPCTYYIWTTANDVQDPPRGELVSLVFLSTNASSNLHA